MRIFCKVEGNTVVEDSKGEEGNMVEVGSREEVDI